MRLGELIEKVQWQDVKPAIEKEYPDDPEANLAGYEKVLAELKQMWKSGDYDKCPSLFIRVRTRPPDEIADEPWTEVDGIPLDSDDEYDCYAIGYSPWQEWLGMDVVDVMSEGFTDEELAAHCLWEMTWGGFTQDDIQDQLDTINESYEDVIERLDRGEEFPELEIGSELVEWDIDEGD